MGLSPGRRRPEEIQVITLSASPTSQKPPRWENDRSKRPGIIDRCCHSVKKTDTKYHFRYIRRQAAFDIATLHFLHSQPVAHPGPRLCTTAVLRHSRFLSRLFTSQQKVKRLRTYVRVPRIALFCPPPNPKQVMAELLWTACQATAGRF